MQVQLQLKYLRKFFFLDVDLRKKEKKNQKNNKNTKAGVSLRVVAVRTWFGCSNTEIWETRDREAFQQALSKNCLAKTSEIEFMILVQSRVQLYQYPPPRYQNTEFTQTRRRRQRENVTSRFCNHFLIIQSHYACKMCSYYPGIKLEPALLR